MNKTLSDKYNHGNRANRVYLNILKEWEEKKMKCAGCSKEFEEQEMAYATVTGNIERNLILKNALGFYMDLKPWESVLCEDCGLAVHDFITKQLQFRNFQESEKPVRKVR